MRLKHWLLYVFCSVSILVSAQTQTFYRDTLVHVIDVNNQPMYNAWGGGLNSAVFAEMDLNNDGVMDLVAYSATNNRIIPMINKGVYKNHPMYMPQSMCLSSHQI